MGEMGTMGWGNGDVRARVPALRVARLTHAPGGKNTSAARLVNGTWPGLAPSSMMCSFASGTPLTSTFFANAISWLASALPLCFSVANTAACASCADGGEGEGGRAWAGRRV